MPRKFASIKPIPPSTPLSPQDEDTYAHILLLVDRAIAARDGAKTTDRGQINRTTPERRVSDKSTARASDAAIRCLIRYFSGLNARKAMVSAGIDWGTLQVMRWSDPDFKRAWDWCHAEKARLLNLKAVAVAEMALDGEAVDKSTLRFAQWLLGVTDRDAYGEHRDASRAQGQGGPAVVYNINLAPISPPVATPNLCEKSVNNHPVIDIVGNK